ncbi:methyltransferase domain-containing protein [bacterium]|nr:methyltransferase domain-containing protein [bacterium]
MVSGLELDSARLVVEVGPGTGIFTDHVLPLLSPRTDFFAVEINPHLAAIFRQRHPDVTLYVDSAVNVPRIVAEHGSRQVDAIISGLPWASFKPELQDELMGAFLSVLKPGGQFVSYGYIQGMVLPAAQRFRQTLLRQFSYVKLSGPVWLNVPPAFYYQCRL